MWSSAEIIRSAIGVPSTAGCSDKRESRIMRHRVPMQMSLDHIRFEHTADVVVVGAGGAGLPAAITARDHGASVIVVEANHDVGGHAILSGGRIPLGGGTSLQRKLGIDVTPDQVFLDHTQY